jgi:hypothetical protein
MQLHALDRISDANVICLVSFKESQPTKYPTPIIHRFASRSIVGHMQATGKLKIVQIFHEHIAQPLTNQLTQFTRMETSKVRPPADIVDNLADSLKRISVAPRGSQVKDESSDMNWFGHLSQLTKSTVMTLSM